MKTYILILLFSVFSVPCLAINKECISSDGQYPSMQYVTNKKTYSIEAKEKYQIYKLKVISKPVTNKNK